MKSQPVLSNLILAYAKEMETVQNYIAASVNLDGVRSEVVKKSLAADALAELGHAQLLANRIKTLEGIVPGSMELPRSQKSLQPPKKTTDIVAIIKGVIEAEEDAIALYKKIIKLSDKGEDYVTQDMAIKLLGDEEQHRREFLGFLKEYEGK